MAKTESTHERLTQRGEIKTSSDRAFGIVFCVVFALIGLWPVLFGGVPRLWSLGLSTIFLLAALIRPALLAPLNRLWTKLGLLLHHVVNPLIMGLLFFLTVTPIALVMRVLGKDPLNLRLDPRAKSYWIERDPPGPAPDTMTNQF